MDLVIQLVKLYQLSVMLLCRGATMVYSAITRPSHGRGVQFDPGWLDACLFALAELASYEYKCCSSKIFNLVKSLSIVNCCWKCLNCPFQHMMHIYHYKQASCVYWQFQGERKMGKLILMVSLLHNANRKINFYSISGAQHPNSQRTWLEIRIFKLDLSLWYDYTWLGPISSSFNIYISS